MEGFSLSEFVSFVFLGAVIALGCSTDPAANSTDAFDGTSDGVSTDTAEGPDTAPVDTGSADTTPVDTGTIDTGSGNGTEDTGSGNGSDDTGTITRDTVEPVRDASGPVGACCSSGRCTYAAQATCESKGKTSKPNETCSSQACSVSTGACCISGLACQNTTLTACQKEGGAFQSATTCSENPCSFSTGACCIENNTECIDSTEANCPPDSATFNADATCADQPC